MDPFVPLDDHSLEMSRHLRPVPVEAPVEGPTYLVGRTEYADPGAPYVVALCVDHRMAGTLALAGQEVHQADEMRADPGLAEALRAWDTGDHRVHDTEVSARSAFSRTERSRLFRQVSPQHPSLLAKRVQ